jgi:hypothetical protein
MTVAQPAFELTQREPAPFGSVVARQLSVWPFASRTAHYVLRHHNRDVLPLDQVNAASAVAAMRGDVAYVALTGNACAFGWRAGKLTGQRGILRLPRPLGLEQDPLVTLWSTPLEADDRLIVVCGAAWRSSSSHVLQEVLRSTSSTSDAEDKLAIALGDERRAGVLVISPSTTTKPARHLHLVPAGPSPRTRTAPDRPRRPIAFRRLLTTLFGLALLATVIGAAFTLAPESRPPAAPAEMSQMIVAPDRVDQVSSAMAVRLGPSAVNVVDLAAGDDALYTLDVVEGSVRAFALDALDQRPTPETLIARTGTPLESPGRRLATPVAIEYLGGGLLVVDQARSVVQVDRSRGLNTRSVPSSAGWQALGAIGSDAGGHLFFVDSAARRLIEYPPVSQRVLDPPQLVLDATTAPGLAFDQIAELVGQGDSLFARLDDDSVHRLGPGGGDELVVIRTSEGLPVVARSMASDRAGGVFLADPANARVLQVAHDGSLIRQLRDPALGGVRRIQTSPDGQRLFGLVASGVLVFDTPAL